MEEGKGGLKEGLQLLHRSNDKLRKGRRGRRDAAPLRNPVHSRHSSDRGLCLLEVRARYKRRSPSGKRRENPGRSGEYAEVQRPESSHWRCLSRKENRTTTFGPLPRMRSSATGASSFSALIQHRAPLPYYPTTTLSPQHPISNQSTARGRNKAPPSKPSRERKTPATPR